MAVYKQLVFLFVGALLVSCGQGSNSASTHKATTSVVSKTNDYWKYLGALDTSNVTTATLAAKEYKELFSGGDTVVNDKAYALFDVYYSRLMQGLNDHFESDETFNKMGSGVVAGNPSAYPPKLAKYAAVLKDNGFEFIQSEGDLAIGQDRDFVVKWFYPSVSATMKKYLDQVNKENKDGLDDDDALLISANDLAERAVWWENFAAAYPHFVLIENVLQQRGLYLTILLKGLDNSPVLNYDSHKLTEFYRMAYKQLLAKHPEAMATKMVKPYYEALLDNNTTAANHLIKQYEDQKLLQW